MNEKERIAWQQHGPRPRPMQLVLPALVWGGVLIIGLYWGWHLVKWIVQGAEVL